ncbi:hypothetical protein M0804_003880 [Polistes exclamans]|nr:hypothetical protein M0804_003880 [Polistes exclamans]
MSYVLRNIIKEEEEEEEEEKEEDGRELGLRDSTQSSWQTAARIFRARSQFSSARWIPRQDDTPRAKNTLGKQERMLSVDGDGSGGGRGDGGQVTQ